MSMSQKCHKYREKTNWKKNSRKKLQAQGLTCKLGVTDKSTNCLFR